MGACWKEHVPGRVKKIGNLTYLLIPFIFGNVFSSGPNDVPKAYRKALNGGTRIHELQGSKEHRFSNLTLSACPSRPQALHLFI